MGLGKIYGVGIGPGDPELVSLKGYRLVVLPALYSAEELPAILAWADVVVCC